MAGLIRGRARRWLRDRRSHRQFTQLADLLDADRLPGSGDTTVFVAAEFAELAGRTPTPEMIVDALDAVTGNAAHERRMAEGVDARLACDGQAAAAQWLAEQVDEQTREQRQNTQESDHHFLAWAVDSYGRSSNGYFQAAANGVERRLDALTLAERSAAHRQLTQARDDLNESARHWGAVAARLDPPVWHPLAPGAE